MAIDFGYKRTPACRIASTSWKGPYSDAAIRRHFESVERWAKSNHLKTGRWFFWEPADERWEVGIEVRGTARPSSGVKLRRVPAATVASVVFDPKVVSASVIWHGLNDWLRWQRKQHKIKRVGAYRETYQGNPWKNKSAWAKVDVQFVVKK